MAVKEVYRSNGQTYKVKRPTEMKVETDARLTTRLKRSPENWGKFRCFEAPLELSSALRPVHGYWSKSCIHVCHFLLSVLESIIIHIRNATNECTEVYWRLFCKGFPVAVFFLCAKTKHA